MVNVIEKLLDGVESVRDEEVFYLDLVPCEFNKYPVVTEEIKDLADSILKYGLFHTIYGVRVKGQDEVTIISGEKRWTAFKYLIEELNHHELEMIPTRVHVVKEQFSQLELQQLILEANTRQRDYSDPKLIQIEVNQALDIIEDLAAKGEKPTGRVRDVVASMIGKKSRTIDEYVKAYYSAKDLTSNEFTKEERDEAVNAIREKGKEEKKNKDLPIKTMKTIKKFVSFLADCDLVDVFEKCTEEQSDDLSKELIELKNVVDLTYSRYYK